MIFEVDYMIANDGIQVRRSHNGPRTMTPGCSNGGGLVRVEEEVKGGRCLMSRLHHLHRGQLQRKNLR